MIRLRQLAKMAGWLLSALCIAYFLQLIAASGLAISDRSVSATVSFVIASAMAYAVGVGLLAIAWSTMLRAHDTGIDRRLLVSGYMVGQFAKYIPGNVFQYIARHGLGISAGAGHGQLIAAAAAEIYLLLCCGTAIAIAFGAGTLASVHPAVPEFPAWTAMFPLGAAFAALLPGRIVHSRAWLPHLSWQVVARTCSCYLVFFLMFGTLYNACLWWTSGLRPATGGILGSAAAAWVAGFVIPGPPAGAGVREAALAYGAGTRLPIDSVTAAIVLFRVVTLVGDFFAFAVAALSSTSGLTRIRSRNTQGPIG